MADDKDNAQGAPWPVPAFHFKVTIDGVSIPFQEVFGLDTEFDVIEYRNANNPILKNAYPKKVTGASMNAKSGDTAIEELVLAHEGLEMAKG